MNSSPQRTTRYRFGPYELDLAEGTLSRSGNRVKLQDLPYRLLVMLVERPGEIVTREEVRQRLWPENTFVEFDNSLGVAIRKVRDSLHDDAETPRYVETIPRRGYRFLAPVTVQDATDTAALGKTTEKDATAAHAMDTPSAGRATPSPSIRRFWIVAGLALLLVGGAIYGFRSFPRRASSRPGDNVATPHTRVRRSVAVLGFRNLPGRPEDNWLSAAFSEMLSTELAAGNELRLVSGEDVARAKSELPLTDEDTLAKSTLERLRTDPGADVVVLGSYTPLADKETKSIRLDIRLQDTAAGETIAEESVTGNEENLFELASQAGIRLRQALGVSSLSAQATAAARASLPSTQEAVRLYTEGRSRSWAFDFLGARDLLLKAVAADPDHPMAHAALSEAWEHLGYGTKALAEARRALDLSERLPKEERLLIDGQFRQTIEDWPKAVESYQSLFNLFPDSLDYGLRLASVQRHVQPADALRTLEVLRHLPPPAGEDPRIDLIEASAWINQDFAKAHAAAERAIAKGNAQGSHLLVARAYGILCQQGPSVGVSTTEVMGACENATQSFAAVGDHNNEARTLNDFAGVYFQQGDLARAEAIWREASRRFRQIGDAEGLAATSNNLGDAFLLQGNLADAKKFLEQSITDYQAIEDKDGIARVLNDLGDLSRQRGDLGAALTTYQQAKATAEEIDDKSVVAIVLTGLGDALTDRGDLAAARKSYEESLTLRNQVGERQSAAETQVALANLSIEEGHAADAEAVLRKCNEQFHHEQQTDDELAASTALIEALLAQGKQADAQKEMESVQLLATKSQNNLVRLQFALVSARVALASDHPGSSRQPLEQVIQEARRHGFLSVDLDAQLALAQLARKTEPAAAAQERLISLEKQARAKGFGLIARKAAAARA
jgi:eukaryotic-like serine/threonine-protein kinase